MYSPDAIRELIEAGLPDANVEVMGDDGTHFAARVVSASFEGKGIVEQHRMVYATLVIAWAARFTRFRSRP